MSSKANDVPLVSSLETEKPASSPNFGKRWVMWVCLAPIGLDLGIIILLYIHERLLHESESPSRSCSERGASTSLKIALHSS